MKTITHFFAEANRYVFDFDLCSSARGYAQLDTSEDAHYYGNWANPKSLKIVSYVEGDYTRIECDNVNEFVAEIRRIANWHIENNFSFGIDPGLAPEATAAWENIGLDEYLPQAANGYKYANLVK